MRKLFLPSMLMFFTVACSNNQTQSFKADTTVTAPDAATGSEVSNADIETSAENMQKRVDELKKFKPISNDDMKSFFPEELMGMKRSSFSVTSLTGYTVGTAEYKKDDTTKYSVVIYDCAGDAGSAFYGMSYSTNLNMEREDDNGYQKTVDYKGGKGFESYTKNNNSYNLSFLTADRFWINLGGDNTGLDNLKSFADALNLDRLKTIK